MQFGRTKPGILLETEILYRFFFKRRLWENRKTGNSSNWQEQLMKSNTISANPKKCRWPWRPRTKCISAAKYIAGRSRLGHGRAPLPSGESLKWGSCDFTVKKCIPGRRFQDKSLLYQWPQRRRWVCLLHNAELGSGSLTLITTLSVSFWFSACLKKKNSGSLQRGLNKRASASSLANAHDVLVWGFPVRARDVVLVNIIWRLCNEFAVRESIFPHIRRTNNRWKAMRPGPSCRANIKHALSACLAFY